MQILQQNDRFPVADLPVSDHLQRLAKGQLQHLDGFVIHPAAAGRSLRVAVLSDKEMHHFGDAPWRHKQLKQLSHLAHFIAGLFHCLFTNAGLRLVVVQQPAQVSISMPS